MFNKPLPHLIKVGLWAAAGFISVVILGLAVMSVVIVIQVGMGEDTTWDTIIYLFPIVKILIGVLGALFIWLWFLYKKEKTFFTFIHDAIPFIVLGLVFYFWYIADNWEHRLSDDWALNPLLANASATFEYVKALVKSVMVIGMAIVILLYFWRSANK